MPDRRAIVVLTGAGLSAESGLATFRGAEGLWRRYDWQRLATPEAFAADPAEVHAFYNARRAQLDDAQPNAAHAALARLQREHGGPVTLITQNVDDLLEKAGAETVLHMHGELARARCGGCGHVDAWRGALAVETPCPACGRTGAMRPHIVWFGEVPFHLEEISDALESCDLFAAIGTSGSVWPAAGFVGAAREAGAETVELNLEESEVSAMFEETRRGPAGQTVPRWVEDVLTG